MLKYRDDIDGLRALAVVPVVLFHAGIPGFSGGFIGVDIFFVISGFLITGIIVREVVDERFSILRFYERRIRRIMPAYMLVCMAVFIVSWWLLLPDDFANMSMSLTASIFFVANMYFAEQMSYFQEAAEQLPLLHLWSLAVEEQFYLIWPILLIVLYRFIHRRWHAAILLVPIIIGVLATEWAVHNKSQTMVFYYAPFRFWELMMGAYLAISPPPRLPSWALRRGLAVIALLLIAGPVILYTSTSPLFPGLSSFVPCLGAAIIIYLGIHEKSVLAPFLGSAPLRGIGLISYSLYLWHWPIFAFTRVYLSRDPFLSEALLLILVSGLAAVLSWRFVEGPFRRSGSTVLLDGWQPAFRFAGAGLATLGVAGVFGIATHGFPARAGSQAQQALVAAAGESPVYRRCVRNRDPQLIAEARPDCSWGSMDSPTKAVIWGDSHAAAYFQGMNAAAEQQRQHLQLFAMQSCAPIASQIRIVTGRAAQACEDFNKHVLGKLLEDSRTDTVYIAGFWLSNVIDVASLEDGRPIVLDEAKLARLQGSLAANVKRLSDRGKRVILLPDTPYFPTGGGRCARQRLFLDRSAQGCAVSRSAHEASTTRINEMLETIASSFPNTVTYKIDDLFCDAVSCVPVIDSAPAFIDKHHLNAHGAEAIMAVIAANPPGAPSRR